VQQQHVDERPGAGRVAQAAARPGPEPLVGGCEHTGGSGAGQRGGARQSAGLLRQDLQVVIEREDLVALQSTRMCGDGLGAVEDLDALGAHTHVQAAPDVAGGDRVVGAPHRHPGLAVHAMRADRGVVERLGRQGPQGVGLQREVPADGDPAAGDVAAVIDPSGGQEQLVELDHRPHVRDRHQMAAPEPAHLALHAALLVRPGLARLAEEAVEPVMGPQRHEPLGLDPVPAPQHPHHRSLQVVVADPARHPAEVVERPDMTVQEHLLALAQIRPRERPTRRRESHDEQLQLAQHPGQIDADRAEVDLGLLAQRVTLGHHHLDQRDLLTGPDLGHEPTHRRLANADTVLVDQSLPHPPGRVTLLAGRDLVGLEPPNDQRLPRIEHARPRRRLLPGRRHRRRQRLAHRAAVNPEPARQLVDRRPLPLTHPPDLLEPLHPGPLRHAPTVQVDPTALVDPTGGAKSHEHEPSSRGQIR
jgi:hypothetical protein